MTVQSVDDYGQPDEPAFSVGPPGDNREPGIYPVSEHFVEVKTHDGTYKISRACPHQGAPLDVYGRFDPATCRLTCVHKGFEWDVRTGAYCGRVVHAAADIEVVSVVGGAQ